METLLQRKEPWAAIGPGNPDANDPCAVGSKMGNLKKFIGPMVMTIVTLFLINRVKVIRDLVYPAA